MMAVTGIFLEFFCFMEMFWKTGFWGCYGYSFCTVIMETVIDNGYHGDVRSLVAMGADYIDTRCHRNALLHSLSWKSLVSMVVTIETLGCLLPWKCFMKFLLPWTFLDTSNMGLPWLCFLLCCHGNWYSASVTMAILSSYMQLP